MRVHAPGQRKVSPQANVQSRYSWGKLKTMADYFNMERQIGSGEYNGEEEKMINQQQKKKVTVWKQCFTCVAYSNRYTSNMTAHSLCIHPAINPRSVSPLGDSQTNLCFPQKHDGPLIGNQLNGICNDGWDMLQPPPLGALNHNLISSF